MRSKKVIVGIDPGTLFTGYGVVAENSGELQCLAFGVIESKATLHMHLRLLHLGTQLGFLFEKYKPKCVVIEKAFFAKNAESAMKLGQARGICLYESSRARLPIFEYNPTEVKKGLTGSGRAEKDQVQMMVQLLLNLSAGAKLEMTKLDMSDALALAIHHAKVGTTLDILRESEINL